MDEKLEIQTARKAGYNAGCQYAGEEIAKRICWDSMQGCDEYNLLRSLSIVLMGSGDTVEHGTERFINVQLDKVLSPIDKLFVKVEIPEMNSAE